MLATNIVMAELDGAAHGAVLTAVVSLVILFLVVIIGKTQMRRINRRLRENYRSIYRVASTPSDNQFILKAEGSLIEVGDYGWEAEPVYQDGLIYLHGLNPQWQVVWYAGFRPEQVEVVGPKPKSHYNIFPYWVDVKKIPQCPFPAQKYQFGKYPNFHRGFPVAIARLQKRQHDWVQGRLVPKHFKGLGTRTVSPQADA